MAVDDEYVAKFHAAIELNKLNIKIKTAHNSGYKQKASRRAGQVVTIFARTWTVLS